MKNFHFIIFSFYFFIGSIVSAANYQLEIINIDNTGDNNRIKFAYPAIEYNMRVAVEGGLYPFNYELTTAPSGLSINSTTGVVTWPNPVAAGSPHSVTVKITDAENNTDTESYTITVTDSTGRFIFVDASYSGTEAGSLTHPYNDMEDFWGNDNTGKIVYFREGTYNLPHTGVMGSRQDSGRIRLSNTKPQVFLGYPGETVTIDEESNPSGSPYKGYHFACYGEPDIYFGNLVFDNVWGYGIAVLAASDHLTVYDCDFRNLSTSGSFSNQSHINYMWAGTNRYHAILSNKFGITGTIADITALIKLYGTSHFVFDNNIFANGYSGLAPKTACDYTTIRNNEFYNMRSSGITMQGYDTGTLNTDISFNLFKSNDMLVSNSNLIGQTYVYRNTFLNCKCYFRYIDSSDGKFELSNNVVVNNDTDSGDTTLNNFYRHKCQFKYSPNVYESLFSFDENLEGISSDNIIDSSGNLIGTYKKQFLGTRGWEIADSEPPMSPSPPKNLFLQPL